ncbi:uncharacterized protein LOC132559736 [Ylistrum balloti]|uniref:uncharacterized protein LOC132559736 n=1 Tax=Ylistrum balloti TaxID=509963 RepID=UPI002905C4DE|nr:uncharacterized protein LOC132559736 [Ylistrum balloti]
MADLDTVTGAHISGGSDVIKKVFSRFQLEPGQSPEHVRSNQSFNTAYDFSHPRRGMAIVISNGKFQSNEPRTYTNVEISNMRTMFEKLGFEVLTFQDLSKRQMVSVLEHAAKLLNYHLQSDCFACVIGSHGAEIPAHSDDKSAHLNRKHVIFGTDKHVDTNSLTDLFSDDKCPGLRHKPKLFFIQACRKDSSTSPTSGLDLGTDVDITSGQHPSPTHVPKFAFCESRRRKPDTVSRQGSSEKNSTVNDEHLNMAADNSWHNNFLQNEILPLNVEINPKSPKHNEMLEKSVGEMNLEPTRDNERNSEPCVDPLLQKTTDEAEHQKRVSKFSLSKFFKCIDEQLSPICRSNFMIMYSSVEGMYSFGRSKEGSVPSERNPVVGGFLLHSLYTLIVRENLFFLQTTPAGLNMLDVFTRVNDFGSKNILATVELQVGENEEDKQTFHAKSVFTLEHRLTDDVIFKCKNAE